MEGAVTVVEALGGIRPVEELLVSGRREVFKLIVAKGRRGLGRLLRQAERRRVPVEFTSRSELDRLCPGSHQGVVALAAPYRYWDIEELKARSLEGSGYGLLLALDAVEDPMNLGAILRVTGAYGADGVLIARDRACGISPAVAKASAGALEHVAIARVVNLPRALEGLKKDGFWVIGTSPESPQSLDSFDWCRDVVVVLGSEGRGIRPLVASTCDTTVAVPLQGPIAALNVAATAAILCYEVWRQRRSTED
jgi:23S rRNA (guanosine2251-2'-O)-methyltransferase